MPMYYFIETGPHEQDIVHEAAQVRTRYSGMSSYAVSLCGVAFRDSDSWVLGFDNVRLGRVTCPNCREIARTTEPLVIDEASLITFHDE